MPEAHNTQQITAKNVRPSLAVAIPLGCRRPAKPRSKQTEHGKLHVSNTAFYLQLSNAAFLIVLSSFR